VLKDDAVVDSAGRKWNLETGVCVDAPDEKLERVPLDVVESAKWRDAHPERSVHVVSTLEPIGEALGHLGRWWRETLSRTEEESDE